MPQVTKKEWERLLREQMRQGAEDEYEACVALAMRGILPPAGSPEAAMLDVPRK